MRKTALLLMTIAFALTVASGIAVAAPLLDQQQTTSDSSVLIDSQGSQFYRQSFTAGISGKLSAVSVYVGCCKDGAVPDGNLFVALYGGGIGAQVAVIPQESVHWTPSGSLNWRTFTLSPAPVVEAGEQYYVRLKSTASQDAGYLWGVTSSDAYSGGDLLHYVDGSGGSSTGNDATFRTYVTPSDGTPPETTITSGPSGTVEHGQVTFEFASSESNSTFKCRVTDSRGIGGWGECTSPTNVGAFRDDTFTFEVKASDASGSTDPTPARRTWTVAIPPTVSLVSPTDGATGVGLNTNVEAWFVEVSGIDPSTITDQTLTLTERGSSTSVAADVRYEGANKATLDPDLPLKENTTYKATIKGGSIGVKDLAGNALKQDYNWTFFTTKAPRVAKYTPTQTSGVPRNIRPTATFSANMDPSTITAANIKFQVYNTTMSRWVGVAHSVSYDATSKTATVIPSSTLAATRKYRVTVTTNVKSSTSVALDQNATTSGNQPKVWTFTTGST